MSKESRLHILQHSLGLDQYGKGPQHRNHFCTGPGSSDYEHCMALTEEGLMTRRTGSVISGGDDIFNVTSSGIDFVALNSPTPTKLTRSKQRYDRYLQYGDGFESFISFCRWDASPDRSWNGGT